MRTPHGNTIAPIVGPDVERDTDRAVATKPMPLQSDVETPDLTAQQFYLHPPPRGFDLDYLHRFPGGTGGIGGAIRVIDVQLGWGRSHEDLPDPPVPLEYGVNSDRWAERHHGTACLGIVLGDNNGYGIRGFAPLASASVADWTALRSADDAKKALRYALPGDVMGIGIGVMGPNADPSKGPQWGAVPLEWDQGAFDAIRYATEEKGVVVVEAAGNGYQILDDPVYRGLFDRNVRDSGAIMVGASLAEPTELWHSAAAFSNSGDRVDVQAYGKSVTTTGYGDAFNGGPGREYTARFSGTSAAYPQIVGLCVCLNSIRKARGLQPWDSFQMRDAIKYQGYPYYVKPWMEHRPESEKIGVFPDVHAIMRRMLLDYDQDGRRGFGDFLSFARYYGQKDVRADLNGDGQVTFSDALEFLTGYRRK